MRPGAIYNAKTSDEVSILPSADDTIDECIISSNEKCAAATVSESKSVLLLRVASASSSSLAGSSDVPSSPDDKHLRTCPSDDVCSELETPQNRKEKLQCMEDDDLSASPGLSRTDDCNG